MAARTPDAPHYPLARVTSASVIRVGSGRARLPVKQRFRRLGKPVNDSRAEAYVRAVVRALTEAAFAMTVRLEWAEARPIMADVYGVRDAFGDWYVKLYLVENGEVIATSCHPPARPLRRADGLRVGGGGGGRPLRRSGR